MRQTCGRILLILPSILWVAAVWEYEGLFSFINMALAALFHECGHLLAFSALGLPMPRITPVTRGVRLAAPPDIPYSSELIIAAAGPLANLAVWGAGMLWHGHFPVLDAFAEVNLLTALCNLAPMADLDGERIVRCTAARFLTDRGLYRLMEIVSGVTISAGLLITLTYYWYTGGGIYPAVLCLAALLSKPTKNEKKRDKKS